MPKNIQETFTDEQLMYLKVAIGARQWGKHSVDFRGVLSFFRYRYYIVFLGGRNRRVLSEGSKKISLLLKVFFTSVLALLLLLSFTLIAYLIKSALGIDLFEGYSFGVWSRFKSLFN
ncbi:3-phosphoshikimate 1-carboxyvinyltransferase [Pseudoalteromonas sp. SG45-1]|uniref:3-phosphoshikimate 1-carboxyvinyltransferase n=1 Tax=unclassified Pseudoalteromonas TaxID=194690 RepID=UPI001603A79E|nr:3-phosphoshikimate 1-carboxyvinyltransferase [Pseudoalteromonas sp. SR41-1]MBB1402136.1 3-phosphoshikimate 1-carboxyvinyltransferase [Pseudoalteromonas sp. SG45-1]